MTLLKRLTLVIETGESHFYPVFPPMDTTAEVWLATHGERCASRLRQSGSGSTRPPLRIRFRRRGRDLLHRDRVRRCHRPLGGPAAAPTRASSCGGALRLWLECRNGGFVEAPEPGLENGCRDGREIDMSSGSGARTSRNPGDARVRASTPPG